MKSAEQVAQVVPISRLPRRRQEREFLPAALEIVETPASLMGRMIAATIMLFFVVAVAWAWFGKVDIIAVAPGKIVPTGRTKVVQPFETGVVRAIHVQDGQTVSAGEVLIELDPTINAAEHDRLAKELLAAQLDAARLRAALSDFDNPLSALTLPTGVSQDQVDLVRQLVTNQVAEYRAKLAALERERAQHEANRAAVAATAQKVTVAIPLLRQRAEARKYLADEGLGSKLTYLEVAQDLAEHEQELIVQRNRMVEAESAIARTLEQRRQTEAEYRRAVLTDLTQADQKARSLSEDLIKVGEHQRLQTLTAPVAGTVQQLAVHTVGGVVTPAQPLLVIVPAESHLEIEAMVSNRDIGFVHAGQQAEIGTFNFTKYGLLHGKVLSISQDAIARDRAPDRSSDKTANGGTEGGESQGQELTYAARISLDGTRMQVEDKVVDLSPGMAVTVEIKTGSRRVIEYLISPLLRYRNEAMRER
jgi:hemolysin D